MGSKRVQQWNVWRKEMDIRVRTNEEFRRLEFVSFTVFVENLPIDVSKYELFYLFKWSGWVNDIHLLKKEKEEKTYCFAFIRRDNKTMTRSENGPHEVVKAGSRNDGAKTVKVVNEREIVFANELVMMICEEDRGNESRVLVSHDILDEWSFLNYKDKPSISADTSSDQYIIVCEKEVFDDRVDLLHLQHMEKLPHLGYLTMNGRRIEDVQHEGEKFITSNHVHPSDLEETTNQIWKVHCQ
ncbi:hypothetical protein PIB30_091235 [Stylosanthes scabra]|uniref:RRM domain-containing protein n=1 Tax=Stylosanthes scabra TaxID=79078 RepID=A0ABU6TTY4_9FABA|nr:hypothetical protein [Stylosanthes scabra]